MRNLLIIFLFVTGSKDMREHEIKPNHYTCGDIVNNWGINAPFEDWGLTYCYDWLEGVTVFEDNSWINSLTNETGCIVGAGS